MNKCRTPICKQNIGQWYRFILYVLLYMFNIICTCSVGIVVLLLLQSSSMYVVTIEEFLSFSYENEIIIKNLK